MRLKTLRFAAACLWLGLGAPLGAAPPPRPGVDVYVADYGALLTTSEKSTLVDRVRQQNEQRSSHLFVVTVASLKSWGATEIGPAAQDCFKAWELENTDVLLLLSAHDRTARIQLGATWGPRWDLEAERIMRDVIVPACQQGNYGPALTQGSSRLLEVTAAGPGGALPARNWWERLENVGAAASRRSGLSWKTCLALMGSGVAMLLVSLLPLGSSTRILAAGLGVLLFVSTVAARGLLSFFWIALGLGFLWGAGTMIQGGFQSGASLAGGGGGRRDDTDYPDLDGGQSEGPGAFSGASSVGISGAGGDGGGATGSW
ncbi:MAG: TPM domain-containing protein [Vulcanimicrobiota bacterium]